MVYISLCRYGYVTPSDVHELLEKQIGQGEVIDLILRFAYCSSYSPLHCDLRMQNSRSFEGLKARLKLLILLFLPIKGESIFFPSYHTYSEK